jgi:hypothetical protein
MRLRPNERVHREADPSIGCCVAVENVGGVLPMAPSIGAG